MNSPNPHDKYTSVPLGGNFFWQWLTKRPIKQKLKLIIMTVSTVGIVVAGFSMLMFQRADIRHSMVTDLSALTEIIAENSESAISFDDKFDAEDILSTLTKKQSITLAILYDSENSIFASSSPSEELVLSNTNLLDKFDQFRFTDSFLEIQKPVYLNEQKLGTVYVRSNLISLEKSMNRLIYSILITLVIVQIFAYFLASYMQRVISRPLIFLAGLARRISEEENYSLRATVHTKDELGDLADDFNNMLDQVERREKALIESEKRFQILIEQAVDAVYLLNMQGRILQVNPSACKSLGYTKDQLLDMTIKDIDIHITGITIVPSSWQEMRSGESNTVYSDFKTNKGNVIPVEIHFGRFEYNSESLILAFARDITQRKLAEAALKQTNDELEYKVEKRTKQLRDSYLELVKSKEKAESANRAKSEFLANMSHEIRTPMNAVMGFTELLKESQLELKQQSYVTSIQSGARGLMTIINDVLDLSKIEAGKLKLEYEAIDTYSFIFDIEKIFSQALLEKELEFEIIIQQELPKALIIDQTRVRQILFNLIGNAIKFTEKGFIRIFVNHVLRDPQVPSNNAENSHVDISFTVQDSGIGIERDQIDKVFEQFVQHKGQSTSKFGGTGLGLTICKNLANMMNGEISVESEIGKGSSFTLQLNDIAVASISDQQSDNYSDSIIEFNSAKILIVDDIEPNRTLVIEQFLNTPLSFLQAENGLQAVEMAQAYYPDLIIMDIRMPVMDGIQATRQIRSDINTKNIPVIALTASVSKADEKAIIHSEFDDFLHKPVRKIDMINALKQFLSFSETRLQEDNVEQLMIAGHATDKEISLLITQLKTIEQNSYQLAATSGMMDNIELFSKETVALPLAHLYPLISQYSQTLTEAASLFDIEKIESLLAEFPNLITDLEQQLKLRESTNA